MTTMNLMASSTPVSAAAPTHSDSTQVTSNFLPPPILNHYQKKSMLMIKEQQRNLSSTSSGLHAALDHWLVRFTVIADYLEHF
jgi:hypothetical protein